METEKHERVMQLKSDMAAVSSHKELAAFLDRLLDAYSDECFEEQDVEDYLEGYLHLLQALDSWIKNNNWGDGAPAQPDWSLMARLLLASFYHS